MSILYPTALADAARRARSRRGWGQTVIGIGIGSGLIAAFSGWNPVLLVIGGVAIVIGFVMLVSAEGHIQNAIAVLQPNQPLQCVIRPVLDSDCPRAVPPSPDTIESF